ncbi:MAG: tRNA (adenosine(37)-N6)-threonylcarbamoyltransferase complex transferase subunit TsaD, partial [Leadbetterella sp.]|nr:tRNA (adenosine(37)-N6)-threonylcarbamoyltransferase complex transferase subunit TsaD [Leadbetterella sp.]
LLAIESSCDETSAAVIKNGKVLNNIVASQVIHAQYGGVVPELASRAHQQDIIRVVQEALSSAGVEKADLSAVAFTRGPGLLGSLLVGTSFAKAFALGLNLPLIEVNHMQAHVLAHFIDDPRPAFPFICLTVSGGHTQLVLVRSSHDMEVIGETADDAVGEAFDKGAKMLGLGYPGGPNIDRLAAEGNPEAFPFPLSEMPDLRFSFSGIKTSLLYFIRDKGEDFVRENLADICASYQHALIRMLMNKLRKAAKKYRIREIAIAGGVSANRGLRKALAGEAEKQHCNIYIPDFQYCTDNAGMIAIAAHYQFLNRDFADQGISPLPRMKL